MEVVVIASLFGFVFIEIERPPTKYQKLQLLVEIKIHRKMNI